MDSGTETFATIAAVVMVLVSLTSGWGAPGAASAVVSDANSMSGEINTPQNVTELSQADNESADEVSDVRSLQGSHRQRVRPLSEYLREMPTKREEVPTQREDVDWLGIEVEDTIDRFEGHDVFGVEVLNVHPSSLGARAGLRSRKAAVSTVLKTVTLVGALVFLPTAAIYHWVLETGAGDRHDLIIGVDGERVHNVSDLENALRHMKEGDIVYLNVLRMGKRLLVPISLAGVGSK